MSRLESGRLSADTAVRAAPNPGPMTLDGTNTWIIGDPTQVAPMVVDPGPADPGHLHRILADCGGRIGIIVLTHRHLDHSEGASALAGMAGCGVRAADPEWAVGSDGLADHDVIMIGGTRVDVLATPGHTSDSTSLLVSGGGVVRLLTGDMVLGRGTTVITYPDGDLADYLQSLDTMEQAVTDHQVAEILPGHGPVVADPGERLRSYRTHRLGRLAEVEAAIAAGAATPEAVVARVYADVDRSVWPAAEQSVRAQLEYLRQRRQP
jgi:glyoxylase-like metal-dependent hydrolase (beta-lactamase superfamily II)